MLSSSVLRSREMGKVKMDWVKSASFRRSGSLNAWRCYRLEDALTRDSSEVLPFPNDDTSQTSRSLCCCHGGRLGTSTMDIVSLMRSGSLPLRLPWSRTQDPKYPLLSTDGCHMHYLKASAYKLNTSRLSPSIMNHYRYECDNTEA